MENVIHYRHEYDRHILQIKRLDEELVQAVPSLYCRLVHILRRYSYLVVPGL